MRKRIVLISIFILVQLWTGGCNQTLPAAPAILPSATPLESLATSLPPAATETPGSGYPVVDAAQASLKGLPIDQFFDESFKILMLRDPESVTAEGLSKQFGMRNDQLTDISDAYIRETQAMQKMIAALLKTYDRAALPSEQQISYDVYAWYLDDLIRQHEFMYNDYPVNPQVVSGMQYWMLLLFTDYQPVASLQEAQDYVSRLEQVDTKFEQLVDGLKRREQAGIIPPRLVILHSLSFIRGIGSSVTWDTPYYKTLQEKVNVLEGVSAADKQAVLRAGSDAIQKSVLPAYKALGDYLEKELLPKAPLQDGLWQYANGEAYYNEYVIPHMTTGDMNAEQLHQLGLKELERIQTEMRVIFDELGYPKDVNLRTLCARAEDESGIVSGGLVPSTYRRYIEQATQNLDMAFNLKLKAQLVVIGRPQDVAYYSSASLDGSRPAAFYAPTGERTRFGMPTMAYHEGVPGHHLQAVIAREADLPLFRNILGFNAYAEGWALYAEKLAAELGWYQDDPYGNLGRLQSEAYRAGRLVADTGINAMQWTFNQAEEFQVKNSCMPSYAMDVDVVRYVATPGQALGYDYGLVKLLELRQRAKDQLGDKFDLKEFHNVVLSNGSMPLPVLEKVVDNYIASKQ